MAVVTDHATRRAPATALLDGFVAFALASHGRAVAALVAVCLCAFLSGFFAMPPIDRDEARFAQATKQMIESGDYIDIRFQDESRYKKPVGIYWLQAAVVKTAQALGVPRATTRIWLYRIPSLLGAIGAVLLTYWAALAFTTRRAAFLAALMMATSILLGVEARLAKTDAVLLVAVMAAMGSFGRIYLASQGVRHDAAQDAASDGTRYAAAPDRSPWFLPAVLWTALAAGVLIKGPLILMFVGLAGASLMFLDRVAPWLRDLKLLPGLAWLALIVLPWFIAIVIRSGDSFFVESVGQDMLAKVQSGQESHGVPPGLYFVLFWVTFFPGSMLAALAAPAVWRARYEPAIKFLLVWIIPSWLLFEAVPTKLPHYVLPLYPAIAILIATMIDRGALSRNRFLVPGVMWWPLITAVIAVVSLWAHFSLAQRIGYAPLPFLIVALIASLFAWWLYRYDGAEISLLRAGIASIMISLAMFGMTFPLIRALFPSYYLVDNLRYAGCPNPQIATAGLHEPSLVFLAGTDLVHTDGTGAAQFLSRGGCRVVFIDARYERPFATQAEAIGLRYSAFGARIDGYNISGGRPVAISSYRAGAAP